MQNLTLLILTIFACAACVAPKKHQTLTARYDTLARRATADSTRLVAANTRLAVSLDSLVARYHGLTDQYLRLKNDSATLAQTYRRNKALLDDLFEKYEQLDRTSRLPPDTALAGMATSAQKERDLLAFEQKLLAQQARNDRQEADLQERALKVLSFEENLRRIGKNTTDLKLLLEKSVGGKDTAVTVQSEAAEVRVSTRETFWFAGNNLTPKAAEVLDKMATVGRTQPNVTFAVRLPFPFGAARVETFLNYMQNKGVTNDKIFFGFSTMSSARPSAEQSAPNTPYRTEVVVKFASDTAPQSGKREKYIPPARKK
jgi:hypothetical protein